MATYYGKLSEFDKDKEDWTRYVERLELFFEANDIEQEEKQKAILLSSCGPSTYKLFKGLTTPRKPREISFKDLIHVMKIHQEPRPNPTAERFKFNTRDRKTDEKVSQYMAELSRLSEFCEYGVTLDNMLRDRLVCGMKHERIQQRLLSEGAALTLTIALDLAQSMESAIEQSSIIKSYQNQERQLSSEIHSVEEHKSKVSSKLCFRCDGKHQPISCPFKDKDCFFCKKKGHTIKVCRKKKREVDTNHVEEEQPHESDGEEMYELYYHENSMSKQPPFKVSLLVNSLSIPMEIDTGASLSIINKKNVRDAEM